MPFLCHLVVDLRQLGYQPLSQEKVGPLLDIARTILQKAHPKTGRTSLFSAPPDTCLIARSATPIVHLWSTLLAPSLQPNTISMDSDAQGSEF
jgi:hypothetical protein